MGEYYEIKLGMQLSSEEDPCDSKKYNKLKVLPFGQFENNLGDGLWILHFLLFNFNLTKGLLLFNIGKIIFNFLKVEGMLVVGPLAS